MRYLIHYLCEDKVDTSMYKCYLIDTLSTEYYGTKVSMPCISVLAVCDIVVFTIRVKVIRAVGTRGIVSFS